MLLPKEEIEISNLKYVYAYSIYPVENLSAFALKIANFLTF